MNQQEFENIFENLSPRRKEVLQGMLAGNTDVLIAKAMGITEPSVRKHIERISQEFGLESQHDGRRYKRSDLIALIAKYKPELLKERIFTSSKEVAPSEETLKTKDINSQETANLPSLLLQMASANISAKDYLDKLLHLADEEEKIQIAKSLNKIGHKEYLEGNFKDAVFYLKRAITFNPNSAVAHYNLGSAYEKLEKLSSAREHYEIAINSNSRAADAAINNLARLSIIDGDNAAAIERVEPILSRVQDTIVKASLHKNLGWAYFQLRQYKQAKKHLLISLKLDSERALTHCLLAKVEEAQGEKQGALASWENCLKYDPDNQSLRGQDWKLQELKAWKLDARRALENER
jgi:tetratricopeptide (TPR) repeat protein